MIQKYDFIMGLGGACSCSQTLRMAGLQLLTLPYDWTVPADPTDLVVRTDFIANDFAGWFDREDLVRGGNSEVSAKGFIMYRNMRTKHAFPHDFLATDDLAAAYPAIAAKYARRIRRMNDCIRRSKRVLIVHIDTPIQAAPTPLADCEYALKRLSDKYPGVRFDLCLFQMEKNRPANKLIERKISEHLTQISFDYKSRAPDEPPYAVDLKSAAGVLTARYSVRDYRTAVERAARRRREREAKWARYGAHSALQYHLLKIAHRLSPRMRQARHNNRTFEHVVPLGINCEAAFRFYDTWGFLDSSLFAWAQCFNLATLTNALGKLDDLFAGTVELDPTSRMWICRNTGVYLHGQLKVGDPDPTSAEIKADRDALLGRVAHLRRKFRDYATDDETTLFVHRLFLDDQSAPDLGDRLKALCGSLDRLGARNWQLLVVCEKPFLMRMPPLPNVSYRAVRRFNPGSAITDTKLGDRIGWHAVYTEFAPAKILPKKHAFKFE